MRRLLIAGAFALACHGGPTRPAASDQPTSAPIKVDTITIGAPSYGGIETNTAWGLLASYLEQSTGIHVRIQTAEPYTELPRLVADKTVDLAELPPLVYVQLERRVAGLHPLATPVISGSPTYLGHLYVRDSSPYQAVRDLAGARIGYVDKGSSSGYLFERDLLRQRGLDPDKLFSNARFFQSHSAVLDAVLAGTIDVGAAIDVTSGWSGLLARPAGLRVLAKTDRIPNDCLVARAGLDPGAAAAVTEALVSLHVGDPNQRKILQAMHMNGWVKADEARYDRVRAVLEREGQSSR